jgi:hypothetical protein
VEAFVAGKEPPEEISRILYEAQVHDAKALERLRNVPIAYTLMELRAIASEGTPVRNDNDRELKRIAKDILATHPGTEDLLTKTLKLKSEELKSWYGREPGSHYLITHKPNNNAPPWDILLGFAHTLPGNQAFRIVGSFLMDAPYHPPVNADDADIVSPADHAYGFLAMLIHKRLPDERVPQNYQEGVEWWKKNAARFAMTPEEKAAKEAAMAKMEAAAKAAAATPAPKTTPVPAVAAAAPQAAVAVSWWLLAVAAVVALLLALVVLMRRKA